jgi:hypothetical protein
MLPVVQVMEALAPEVVPVATLAVVARQEHLGRSQLLALIWHSLTSAPVARAAVPFMRTEELAARVPL